MSKRIIEERYLKFFESYYIDLGYSFYKKTSSYLKDEFEIFLGPDAVHPGSISLMPKFKIRNEKIISILNKVFPGKIEFNTSYYRVQNMEFAFECGVSDDKIIYSPYNSILEDGNPPSVLSISTYIYYIEEDTDLAPILDDHIYFMEKVTFPFFEKMKTLEGIDSFTNDRVLEGDMAFFSSDKRQMFLKKVSDRREAFGGLIAARLNDRPNYDELVYRYQNLYPDSEYFLNQLALLTDYLK